MLGAYLASTGLVRFGIEFLRVRQSLVGPFALAHLLSFAALCIGVALLSVRNGRGAPIRTA